MNAEFLSCADLQSSLYLGPDEIRACCQRFFVNGVQKGDVVLLKTSQFSKIEPEHIITAKNSLIQKVNNTKNNECSGCPKLEKKSWGVVQTNGLQHLSLEHHSVCNLRCTYCSDKFYGGIRETYELLNALESMKKNSWFSNLKTIRWGGGEPFLDPNYKKVFEFIDDLILQNPNLDIRIFSNSLRFCQELHERLFSDNFYLTTSLDAGTESTYKLVRKKFGLEKVVINLAKYAKLNAEKITIKYIITKNNYNIGEIPYLIELMEKHKLQNCNFQISLDFTQEDMLIDQILFAGQLYSALRNAGFSSIFLDDLLLIRLLKSISSDVIRLREAIERNHLDNEFGLNISGQKFIVYGQGEQANQILKYSQLLKKNMIEFITDSFVSEKSTNGKYEIEPKNRILASDSIILIAATQSYPIILKELKRLGVSSSRIYSNLII